jgi:hypothetical protein
MPKPQLKFKADPFTSAQKKIDHSLTDNFYDKLKNFKTLILDNFHPIDIINNYKDNNPKKKKYSLRGVDFVNYCVYSLMCFSQDEIPQKDDLISQYFT